MAFSVRATEKNVRKVKKGRNLTKNAKFLSKNKKYMKGDRGYISLEKSKQNPSKIKKLKQRTQGFEKCTSPKHFQKSPYSDTLLLSCTFWNAVHRVVEISIKMLFLSHE